MSFINDIINRLKNKKTMANPTNKLHFETLQVRVGQEQADQATDSRAVPIYATTAYVFHSAQHASDRFHLKDAGNVYGRITNTTQGVFEARVAALEGGAAGLAVSSGAAAITYAIQNIAESTQDIADLSSRVNDSVMAAADVVSNVNDMSNKQEEIAGTLEEIVGKFKLK